MKEQRSAEEKLDVRNRLENVSDSLTPVALLT